MTTEPSLISPATERPTKVRHLVVAAATTMAVILYLDRLFVGIAAEYIRQDLHATQTQMSRILSAFFLSYALGQVPAGWLSDRFGARRMLTFYILVWSVLTGLLGFATEVWVILYLRLFFGAAQAGAYPTAGGLIRDWIPITGRGTASSIVALGGRAGGVLAPLLTAWLIIFFSQGANPATLGDPEIVDSGDFLKEFAAKPGDPRLPMVEQIRSRFSEELNQQLNESLKGISTEKPKFNLMDWLLDWGDWVPKSRPPEDRPPLSFALVGAIANKLKNPGLLGQVDPTHMKQLDPKAVALYRKRAKGDSLTDAETVTLNRLVVEATFPTSVKQMRGPGWRPTTISYGLVGIAIAIGFLIVVRDQPSKHPHCNLAERELIDDEPTRAIKAAEPPNPPFPMVPMLTNLSLWGNSIMQFFTNVGWVFAVTWLPRYLDKVHGVPLAEQAIMTAIPTAAGIVGMYVGGWWTDRATRSIGRKWGRRLPVVATRFSAAAGYGICLLLSVGFEPGPSNWWLPWGFVAALCLMTISVDMGNPAVWAYAQDVGGKFTGSILGWANMWGNLGAAAAPLIYNAVLGEKPQLLQWNMMFGVCLLAFVLSGLCGCVLDATKSLVQKSPQG